MRIISTAAVVLPQQPPIVAERFSSFKKLLRVVAIIISFALKLCRKDPATQIELLKRAETLIFKWTQGQYFASEISCVSRKVAIPASSKLAKYGLFFDDEGVLRLQTRLTNTPSLTTAEKTPIVLPGEPE